jgi:hypothetical protein
VLTYIFDIDGTICDTPRIDGAWDYTKSTPLWDRIQVVNRLYDEGHKINYWTARGSSSGKDWYQHTLQQLGEWGCKYHSFNVGKPSYDVWVDDKAFNDRAFFRD